mgnify:CR=1 FL=1
MLRAAVYGYGNIGRFSLEALLASPDFEVAGVVSASLSAGSLGDIPVVRSIDELSQVDVAILCSPSRAVPDLAAQLLEKGISIRRYGMSVSGWTPSPKLMALPVLCPPAGIPVPTPWYARCWRLWLPKGLLIPTLDLV